MKVFEAQSCLTLCDPMGCSPPGSFSHGILQAEILEWIAISRNEIKSQKKSKWCPLPDFIGSLWQRLFFASQLSLGFWTCQLVTPFSRWDLLSVSTLGWGQCLSSEVMGDATGWEQLERTSDLVLNKQGCRTNFMIAWVLWSGFLDYRNWVLYLAVGGARN